MKWKWKNVTDREKELLIEIEKLKERQVKLSVVLTNYKDFFDK